MKRRVRIDLEGGHMDLCLEDDATPETIEALKALGQAAVARMASDDPPVVRGGGQEPGGDT